MLFIGTISEDGVPAGSVGLQRVRLMQLLLFASLWEGLYQPGRQLEASLFAKHGNELPDEFIACELLSLEVHY